MRAASGSRCAVGVPTKRATPWASRTLVALVSSCCILALQSSAVAAMIGINFYKTGAGQQMLDPSEEAGVEPQVHWNNVYWNGKSQLHNDSGLVTAVSVATTTSKDRDATWVPVGPSSSGDFRLMRQYIHSEGSGMTVI